jgi:hypothetical protein
MEVSVKNGMAGWGVNPNLNAPVQGEGNRNGVIIRPFYLQLVQVNSSGNENRASHRIHRLFVLTQ